MLAAGRSHLGLAQLREKWINLSPSPKIHLVRDSDLQAIKDLRVERRVANHLVHVLINLVNKVRIHMVWGALMGNLVLVDNQDLLAVRLKVMLMDNMVNYRQELPVLILLKHSRVMVPTLVIVVQQHLSNNRKRRHKQATAMNSLLVDPIFHHLNHKNRNKEATVVALVIPFMVVNSNNLVNLRRDIPRVSVVVINLAVLVVTISLVNNRPTARMLMANVVLLALERILAFLNFHRAMKVNSKELRL